MDGFRGKLEEGVSLALHTSWKIGGIARRCYQAADLEDLGYFLSQLSTQEPLLWLGLGSNTLIREQGFTGTVILMKGGVLNAIQRLDTSCLRVEAGVACPVLARFCARYGLTGLEFLAGIPGTIGGALAMNAGAHGSAIWDFVSQVETINRQGQPYKRSREAYSVGYRSVQQYPNEWFVATDLSLKPDETKVCWDRIRAVLAYRTATQPNQCNAGSIFRNPAGYYAGRLIEQCGLKGTRLGGAMVSEKHANFIINRDNATSFDIEALIQILSMTVMEKYGLQLIPEVHIYPRLSCCASV